MKSPILETATRYLLPILLMFSIFVLLRGHQLPGGGFVGGLIAAAAFALHAFAFDVKTTRALLPISSLKLIPIGLSIALSSGLFPMFYKPENYGFMKGVWYQNPLPAIGKIGTPFFFDIGVYFVVLGAVLVIIFSMFEDREEGDN